MMNYDREIAALRAEIRRLRHEVYQRPIKPPKGATTSDLRLVIDRGNTLVTTQLGIVYSSTAITDVPSAYDPTVTSSFIDGIGRATLYVNGTSQGYVLVCNDGTSGSAINFDLLGDTDADVCRAVATKTLTVAGDPNTTVTAYIPDTLL